jgi:sulfite exporter TauE/SafE
MDGFVPTHLISALAPLCTGGGANTSLGIGAIVFSAGLLGGFAHCAPMCGPFVLMQISGAIQLSRAPTGLLPHYHLGRLTTYGFLGAALGGFSSHFANLEHYRWILAGLLLTGALGFVIHAVGRVIALPRTGIGTLVATPLARIASPLISRNTPLARYLLGILLGFLPCGFLYSALALAAATGGALGGGLVMGSFALGTFPALAVVGLCGSVVAKRFRPIASAALTPLLLVNAAALAVFAIRAIG